jgi:triacylglycerol lipase
MFLSFPNITQALINVIPPFVRQDLNVFDSSNAFASLIQSEATTQLSGYAEPMPPFTQDFELLEIFKGYDKFALKNRDFGVCAYSEDLDFMTLSFAGTTFTSEWLDDADYAQVVPKFYRNPSIKVHRGFHDIYASMRLAVYQQVMPHANTHTLILLTGHSLGGALATLFFGDFQANNISNVILYTFGAPRVGNVAFAEWITSLGNGFRVNNIEDIVTNLPLPVNLGYLYQQSEQCIDFSLNLGNVNDNHLLAYKQWLSQTMLEEGSEICGVCLFITGFMEDYVQTHGAQEIQQGLEEVCLHIPIELEGLCELAVESYGPKLEQFIIDNGVNELSVFCKQIDLCPVINFNQT